MYREVNCPASMARRRELVDKGEKFKYVLVGQDIPMDKFFEKYPDVKSVPFETEEPDGN